MQRRWFLLALLAGMCAGSLPAQITLTVADLPLIGARFTYDRDTNALEVTPGPPGANLRWDFSGLTAHERFTVKVVAARDAPDAGRFPEANIALLVDSIYIYSLQNEEGLFNLGAAVDLTGSGNPVLGRFTPPQKLFQFPTTLGTRFEQNYALRLQVDGDLLGLPVDSVRLIRRTVETVTADAYGTLTIPGASYETLRLHTVAQVVDSFFVQSFGTWVPFARDESMSQQYRWVAKGGKANVMTLYQDGEGQTESVEWLNETVASLASLEQMYGFRLYPNPVGEQLRIDLAKPGNRPLTISFYTPSGQEILRQGLTGSLQLETGRWTPGSYLFVVRDERGAALGSGKVVKR